MPDDKPCAPHNLRSAVEGCGCSMRDVTRCVICGRDLSASRVHVDTCGSRCFGKLLEARRAAVSRETLTSALAGSSPVKPR